jgi:hypothetical protein
VELNFYRDINEIIIFSKIPHNTWIELYFIPNIITRKIILIFQKNSIKRHSKDNEVYQVGVLIWFKVSNLTSGNTISSVASYSDSNFQLKLLLHLSIQFYGEIRWYNY